MQFYMRTLFVSFFVMGCGQEQKKDYSVSACIQYLEDTDPDTRYTAVSTLGKYGPEAEAAVPALTKALRDPDKNVRVGALYALGEIGPAARSAVPAIRKAAQDPNTDVRAAATHALKQLDGKR